MKSQETSKPKLLVVDDEPGIVQIARDYLDRAGFRVVTAGDGASAPVGDATMPGRSSSPPSAPSASRR